MRNLLRATLFLSFVGSLVIMLVTDDIVERRHHAVIGGIVLILSKLYADDES